MPEPSTSDVVEWLLVISRGLDWEGLPLEPFEL